MRGPRPSRQRGAIAILVGLTLIAILAMVGLVLDLGHLHIVKNELQNAADACALSGAQELFDTGPAATPRIVGAAVAAGNQNHYDFQRNDLGFSGENVKFSASSSGGWESVASAATRYIQCTTPTYAVRMWFMWMARTTPAPPGAPFDISLNAVAVAGRVPGQTLCAIPIAMCRKEGETFVVGTWYPGRLAVPNGRLGWVLFPGMHGAADIADLIAGNGLCARAPDHLNAHGGVVMGAAQAWNTRFGLYAGTFRDMSAYPPDRTGYAYTPTQYDRLGNAIGGTWLSARNAYGDYASRRESTHDPYDPASLLSPTSGGPMVLPGSPHPITAEQHAAGDHGRRMVLVPVIGDCSVWDESRTNVPIEGYACALMTRPVNDPDVDITLEYRGLSTETDDCGAAGVPGGTGARVAALVQ